MVFVGALCALAAPASAAGAAPQGLCLRALTALTAGRIADAKDFAAAPCPEHPATGAFRYDAARGATLVVQSVAADEIVRGYADFRTTAVVPGQHLRLVVAYGAARIERDVEALQAARPGQRLFVRGGDGTILSVRYERAAP